MKKNILAALFPFFLIPNVQAQSNQFYSTETPLVYSSNLRPVAETTSSAGYPIGYLPTSRKDRVVWISDHTYITPGNFKLVLPFPLMIYKTKDEKTEMAFVATSGKYLVLLRHWF